MFQITRDEVDYAIFGFACTYARSKVALCGHSIDFTPVHFLTRYPPRLSPIWNLTRLCPISVWYWVFASLAVVVGFFMVASVIYSAYLDLKTFQQEIILFPFRYYSQVKEMINEFLHSGVPKRFSYSSFSVTKQLQS